MSLRQRGRPGKHREADSVSGRAGCCGRQAEAHVGGRPLTGAAADPSRGIRGDARGREHRAF